MDTRPSPTIAILADDLTSAADGAAPFVDRGLPAALDRLDVSEFEILQELEPGFPLGRARLGDGRPFLLAMKAGGFGADDALARAVARIRGASQPDPKEAR